MVEVLGKALTLFHRSVLGPGLGLEGQVLVNITGSSTVSKQVSSFTSHLTVQKKVYSILLDITNLDTV